MMHHIKQKRIWLVSVVMLGVLGLFSGQIAAQEPVKAVVVTHGETAQADIQKKDLKDIYLGRKTTWNDKTPIIFVVLKEGQVHEDFLKDYVGKTPSQFTSYWKQQVFTGKGKMPKEFETEEKLMAYVAKTKGAIGYIGPKTEIKEVKKLTIKD